MRKLVVHEPPHASIPLDDARAIAENAAEEFAGKGFKDLPIDCLALLHEKSPKHLLSTHGCFALAGFGPKKSAVAHIQVHSDKLRAFISRMRRHLGPKAAIVVAVAHAGLAHAQTHEADEIAMDEVKAALKRAGYRLREENISRHHQGYPIDVVVDPAKRQMHVFHAGR